MAPRRTTQMADPDIIDQAVEDDKQRTAEDLTDVLDFLGGVTGSDVKVIIYQVTKSGKWAWIKELMPPINSEEVFEELRDNYGAGDYVFRVMASNKIRGTKHFSIAGAKTLVNPQNISGGQDMTRTLLELSDRSRADQTQMMTLIMTMMQQSSQQMLASQQNSTQLMMGLVTAMMSNKENPTQNLVALAGLFQNQDKGGMKEAMETLVAAKGLFGDSGSGGDGGFMDLAGKLAPAAGSLLEGIMKRGQDNGAPTRVSSVSNVETPQQILPQRRGPVSIPQMVEAAELTPEIEATGIDCPTIVALIREDVLFFMRKVYEPETAAENIAEVLDKAQQAGKFQETDLVTFAMEVQGAGENWPLLLKSWGVDVTGYEEWFSRVFAALTELYGSNQEQSSDSERQDGSETNASIDEDPGSEGEP